MFFPVSLCVYVPHVTSVEYSRNVINNEILLCTAGLPGPPGLAQKGDKGNTGSSVSKFIEFVSEFGTGRCSCIAATT